MKGARSCRDLIRDMSVGIRDNNPMKMLLFCCVILIAVRDK